MEFEIVKIFDSRYLKYLGDWPGDQDDAWRITLNKWAILAESPRHIFDGRFETCGLCMYYTVDGECGDCPISAMGFDHCRGTPYYDYGPDKPEAAIEEFWFLLAAFAAGLEK